MTISSAAEGLVSNTEQALAEDQPEEAQPCQIWHVRQGQRTRCPQPADFLLLGHCDNQHTSREQVCAGHERFIRMSPASGRWTCNHCGAPYTFDSVLPL